MSNGKNWRSYLAIFDDPVHVETYLSNARNGTYGRVDFEGLMKDTDTSRPPTREWYKLHLIAVTRDKVQPAEHVWSPEIIAWGLNIWESGLLVMQRNLMQEFACIRCQTPQNGKLGRTGEGQPNLDFHAYSLVEADYQCTRSRFSLSPDTLEIDYEWRMAAIYRIVMDCWKNSSLALDRGYYSKTDGRSTETGDTGWQDLSAQAAKNDRSHGHHVTMVSQKRAMEDDESERSLKRSKLDVAMVSHKRAMEEDEGERSLKRPKLDVAMVSQKRAMEDDESERSLKRPKLDVAMVSQKRTMEEDEGERSLKRPKLDVAMVSQKRAMEQDEGERSLKRPKTTQYTA